MAVSPSGTPFPPLEQEGNQQHTLQSWSENESRRRQWSAQRGASQMWALHYHPSVPLPGLSPSPKPEDMTHPINTETVSRWPRRGIVLGQLPVFNILLPTSIETQYFT